jgi:hypothetical protein
VVGLIVKLLLPPDPVTLPVIVPLTPARVAVTVTLETGATPVTKPVAPTGAQPLELCQVAELVTSFVPRSKLPVAFSWAVEPFATEKVLLPEASLTVIELG